MLNARQDKSRTAIELGGAWNFKLDQETSAAQALMPGLLRDGGPVAVPASHNDQKDVMEYRDHYGWAYHQRTPTMPILLKGRRLWLRFSVVAHSAMIWLGDILLYTHKGGSLSSEAEITDLAESEGGLLLTVAVDNRLNHSTLPVGDDPTEIVFSGSDNAGIPSVGQTKRKQKL